MTLRTLVLLALIALAFPLAAQNLADPRLDPAALEWLRNRDEVAVVVQVDGSLSEARLVWRQISRALDRRYGRLEEPPDVQRRFLARVNRFGLVVLLSFEQVERIDLPFEMTLP